MLPTVVAVLLLSTGSAGQMDPGADGWNDPGALELVERGRQARRQLSLDGDLETYRALTEGHVYFFVDPEEGRRSLIRVDQVAVELQWQAPDLVRQRIVGERSETRLPVRDFRYYLDRLTLVQYGFGDEIQVGSGMDVAGVPHPFAPLPDSDPERAVYDFRISDSLTLRLPGRPDPIRLTELEVRPRDPTAPGVMGTLLLERVTGHIVRMTFSFTPASYVDRRTDWIEVDVDYGLWEGRYWLPNRQRIEVRRELPEVDLGVGTVIRAVLRVGDYELNVPLPPDLVWRPPVVFAPEEERTSHPFAEGLLDRLEEDGLAGMETRADPRELRARARELLANRPPTGLSPVRLHLPGISSAVRYNRTEGAFAGMGGSVRPSAGLRARAHGGFAFGPRRAAGSLRLDGVWADGRGWELGAGANQERDLGVLPAADPLTASVGALLRAEDYADPFRTSWIDAVATTGGGEPWHFAAGVGLRRDRTPALAPEHAPLDRARRFREVRPVAHGTFLTARVLGTRAMSWPGRAPGELTLSLQGLSGDPGRGVEPRLDVRGSWSDPAGSRELEARLVARSWLGDPLPQGHRLIGGRGTVPGYPLRGWAGREVVLGSVEGAMDLGTPLIRGRAGLHAGWAGGGDPVLLEAWEAGPTRGFRPAASLGLGVGWDVLRVTAARGLREGEWQFFLSIDPRWWDQL